MESQNRSLTVDKLSSLTAIPASKIRQRLTTFEFDIVHTDSNTYDLAKRVYKNKTFRYTPTAQEIEKGFLKGNNDLELFLRPTNRHNTKIILIDKNNKKYTLFDYPALTDNKHPRLKNISVWYKSVDFEQGDDILFTCMDLSIYTFLIKKEGREKRDEFYIAIKNKKLADLIYNIINHTISKYESYLFLVRKYIYIYPYNEPVPPDHLAKALANDNRFIISSKDKILSWTGHLLNDWLTIGLKKYYYQNDQGEWTPVFIGQNKHTRKFGYCSKCGDKMYWTGEYMWKHPKIQGEYSRRYLNLAFFTFEKNKKIQN